MLSNESYNVAVNPHTLPSRQVASTSYNQEGARDLTPSNGAEGLDTADAPHPTAAAVESLFLASSDHRVPK
jgi:hypothetical protein